MKTHISYIAVILALLTSCSSMKLRRAERLIKKAEQLGATWRTDTVTIEHPFFLPEIRRDTTVIIKPGDTVVIEKERLRVQLVRAPGDTVYVEAVCAADTVYKEVPVAVTKTIEARCRWTLGTVVLWALIMLVAGVVIGFILKAVI
jgi:hypothetical protein